MARVVSRRRRRIVGRHANRERAPRATRGPLWQEARVKRQCLQKQVAKDTQVSDEVMK